MIWAFCPATSGIVIWTADVDGAATVGDAVGFGAECVTVTVDGRDVVVVSQADAASPTVIAINPAIILCIV